MVLFTVRIWSVQGESAVYVNQDQLRPAEASETSRTGINVQAKVFWPLNYATNISVHFFNFFLSRRRNLGRVFTAALARCLDEQQTFDSV